jgi:signal peptidase I
MAKHMRHLANDKGSAKIVKISFAKLKSVKNKYLTYNKKVTDFDLTSTTENSTDSKQNLQVSSGLPSVTQLEAELEYEKQKKHKNVVMRNVIFLLITVSAIAVLVATLLMPVLQIYGSSMTPTLSEGNIVVSIKGTDFKQGDIISFYYNNKILVKRVIAFSGDWVNIDEDGNVYVNDQLLDEPYLTEKAFGECDLEFPYQVPDGKIFVCGDHRSTSVDSRSSIIGCVSEEQLVGKILFKVWPLSDFGSVD